RFALTRDGQGAGGVDVRPRAQVSVERADPARHASTNSTGLRTPLRIASAASLTPSEVGSADRIEHLRDHLEAAERGHEVGAGITSAYGAHQLLRHLDPDAEGAIAGLAKPPATPLWNRGSRPVVVK